MAAALALSVLVLLVAADSVGVVVKTADVVSEEFTCFLGIAGSSDGACTSTFLGELDVELLLLLIFLEAVVVVGAAVVGVGG